MKPPERNERVCMGHSDTRACPHGNAELRTHNSKGFTLLELIIVMFLASLILGLSTVFFLNSVPSARLDATGREISATIRHAKSIAQNKGEDQVFMINLDTRQYGIEGRGMKTIPAEISVRVSDPFSGEIRRGMYPILFRAYGGAEGGTVVLQGRKKAIYIRTDPVVGSVVTRQRYGKRITREQ